jgi:hypothetical protein
MAVIHKGATLTPPFREFLPTWLARQPWYLGSGIPSLKPVGFFRFEDPDGEVGIETHLATDGEAVYQIPMTYRGMPVDGLDTALITTAEHSVLGTRWIYDGLADPVWQVALLSLIRSGGDSDQSSKQGVGAAVARGQLLGSGNLSAEGIEVTRVPRPGEPVDEAGVVALVMGTWHPDGADAPAVTGRLAVVRETSALG